MLALLAGPEAETYRGLAHLPQFVPEDESAAQHPEVLQLRESIAKADAVLFCAPEYAGGLPGSLKNLLDWLVGTGELYDKPVGWINAANRGRGEAAQRDLETVLNYVGARIIAVACVRIEDARDAFVDDADLADRERVETAGRGAVAALLAER